MPLIKAEKVLKSGLPTSRRRRGFVSNETGLSALCHLAEQPPLATGSGPHSQHPRTPPCRIFHDQFCIDVHAPPCVHLHLHPRIAGARWIP